MTYDERWAAEEEARRAWMAENSPLPRRRRACVLRRRAWWCRSTAAARRQVVQNGIDALKAIWHRGAVDADGKTGDGAGIHVQIPFAFFHDQIERTGHKPRQRRADGGGPGVPAAHRFRRAGNLPDHRRDRSPAHGLLHLWLAPRAGEHRRAGREGQRDAARDRADPDLQRQGRRRGDVRARALRHPPADREGGGGARRSSLYMASLSCRSRSSTRA